MHTCQSISHKGETEGLVSQFVLDEFWDMATSEMLSVLRQHCVNVTLLFYFQSFVLVMLYFGYYW